MSDVMNVEEAARRLNLNTKTVYEAIKRGQIPGAVRIGRAYRLSRKVFLNWLGEDDGCETKDLGRQGREEPH